MKMFVEPDDIYLHIDAVDFRKTINGLLVIVEYELELNAFTGALFMFTNYQEQVSIWFSVISTRGNI
jgi:transposase